MNSKRPSAPVFRATLSMEDADFGPFDHCLYCLEPYSIDRKPTDEHIVPDFAGGKVVIEDGACEDCARRSNGEYETTVAQTTFFAYRLWSGFLKPKARGLLPMAPGDVTSGDPDGRDPFTLAATKESRPPVFTLLIFGPPYFWQRAQANRHTETLRAGFYAFRPRETSIRASILFRTDRRQRLQAVIRTFVEDLNITVQERHDVDGFYLMLAKIGYCFAVASLGFAAFDHANIRALLNGRRADFATFVGYYVDDHGALLHQSRHYVHLRLRGSIWIAIVHLYADGHPGGTPYEVVLGKAR